MVLHQFKIQVFFNTNHLLNAFLDNQCYMVVPNLFNLHFATFPLIRCASILFVFYVVTCSKAFKYGYQHEINSKRLLASKINECC